MAKGEKQTVDIYALCHPVTGEVRYIGKANDTKKRLASHIRDSRRRDTPVYRWIRKLATEGLVPVAKVLEVCEGPWQDVEIRLIAEHKKTCRLLNVAIGGDEPCCPTETRAANGRKVARQIHDNPLAKKLWTFKKLMADDLRFFKNRGMTEVYNKNVRRLKELAQKYPQFYSCWSNLAEI